MYMKMHKPMDKGDVKSVNIHIKIREKLKII